MTPRDRAYALFPWVAAAVLIAGVVHLVSVLLIPHVAPRDAYRRLLERAKSGPTASGAMLLPRAVPGVQALTREDPAMVAGACVFDLSKGLFHVRASVGDDEFLGLSFHAATGPIFHAVTDRGANKGKIDIVVGDARQIEDLAEADEDDATPQETRVTAPGPKGFVMIRALAKRPSDAERATQAVMAVRCETMPAEE